MRGSRLLLNSNHWLEGGIAFTRRARNAAGRFCRPLLQKKDGAPPRLCREKGHKAWRHAFAGQPDHKTPRGTRWRRLF